MRDIRTKRTFSGEKEEGLEGKSAFQVMDNFACALDNIWPNLVNVNITGWDSWDRVVSCLYRSLIVETFAYKHGLGEDELDLTDYGSVQAKRSVIEIGVAWDELEDEVDRDARDQTYFFHSFSNRLGVDLSLPANLTFRQGTVDPDEGEIERPEDMTFSHVVAEGESGAQHIVIPRDSVDYELVLRD